MPDFDKQQLIELKLRFLQSEINRLKTELHRIHWEHQNELFDADAKLISLHARSQQNFEDIQLSIEKIHQVLGGYYSDWLT